MAHLQRSVAALRISGEQLIPAEVTALLGILPNHAYAKGDEQHLASGRVIVKNLGFWGLEASDAEPENLDAQVEELLSKLSTDLELWRELAARFEIDLFCGWFMASSNEGVEISAHTLRALGERGIKLSLDIYGPERDA